MKWTSHRGRTLALLLTALGAVPGRAASAQLDARQMQRLAQVRVPFVENCGQWDEPAAFAARTQFGSVLVTREGRLVYSLGAGTLTETMVSGTPAPQAGHAAVTRVSYFLGNDASHWQSRLPTYDEVGLGEVWSGITVSLRARESTVEKILTIQPGARAETIQLRLDGSKSLRIDADGRLVATTGDGEIRFTAPEAYQEQGASRRPVEVAYFLRGNTYGFRLGVYDHAIPVVIDPLLQSTYFGGTQFEFAQSIAIHPTSGEVFLAGGTVSTDLPGAAGGAQPAYGGGNEDAFVARFDPTLTTLLQATYLGGGGSDFPAGLAIHPTTGEIVILGNTNSPDLPSAAGGAQPTFGGGEHDAFVARLDPTLSMLLQSTYLGGSQDEFPQDIAISPTSGEIVAVGVTGSWDFPGTAGGAQATLSGVTDGFVARLSPTLTTLLQSTYLGGSEHDYANAVAIEPTSDDVFVAGQTLSTDFPGVAGAAQSSPGGSSDAFVARLDPTLTTLLQSTYLGGSSDEEARCIAIHPISGDIVVGGVTGSFNFPGTAGGAQAAYGGTDDAFMTRLAPALTTILQSTYLGGGSGDQAARIAIDPASGDVFVGGFTVSAPFPGSAGGAQPSGGGIWDAFIARLDAALTTLERSTYLGGSGHNILTSLAIDSSGANVFVAEYVEAPDFPGTAGGAQPLYAGGYDAVVARLTADLGAILSPIGLSVDPLPNPGDGDFIFEPGETVPVIPSWQNPTASPIAPTGQVTLFTGPDGATYTILAGSASYSTIPPGGVGIAGSAYSVSVSAPATRPATHWDAALTETLDVPYVLPYRHILHIGDSFPDVPRANLFYPFVETVLHHDVTAGCGSGAYCPDGQVTRAQMAVFLLKSKHGRGYEPPHCTGIFNDVPCVFGAVLPDWIEELFREGITGGCGGGNYCPEDPVTRAQMAVLLLKAAQGSAYTPPACASLFGDVPCPSPYADWIGELAAEQITGGCGGGNYCPDNPNTRGQMAVFLVKTFGLQLYGP